MMSQGAQAGAAFGPWGAAIGGAAGLVGDIATAPDTGVSVSGAGNFDLRNWMDGSGWTVSTGSSKATADNRREEVPQQSMWGGMSQAMPSMTTGLDSTSLMLMVGLVIAVAVWRRG